MKLLTCFLFLTLTNFSGYSQSDPIEDFKCHKFPCDSGSTTLEINFCSGAKLEYVDSLLNAIYRKIIKSINKEIVVDEKKLKIKQSIKIDSIKNKDEILFLVNEINYDQRLKTSIIQSQKEWIKMRDLNSKVISITCEGGRECIAINNLAEIDDVLERIKKLQSFYDL
jgi:uncharacterized protein YecT (DUF1311 family)